MTFRSGTAKLKAFTRMGEEHTINTIVIAKLKALGQIGASAETPTGIILNGEAYFE